MDEEDNLDEFEPGEVKSIVLRVPKAVPPPPGRFIFFFRAIIA